MTLTTSVLHDDGVALLALAGELDLGGVVHVDAAVDELLDDGFALLVVDLSALEFCDSSGLGALLRTTRRLQECGGTCLVAGARGAVARLMALTSMERVLALSADVAPALAELRQVAEGAS